MRAFASLLPFLIFAAACAHAGASAPAEGLLRVCADANNLPYSNAAGEGFENALAELLADELGLDVAYTWWPQRRGFLRNTLDAGRCDVVMGVLADDPALATTAPYYHSAYVLVSRAAEQIDIRTLEDPRLRTLAIGVHTVGDDYAMTPPAQVLARYGIRANVHGYSIFGDYALPAPARQPVDAVAQGAIDVALVWGPIGGFFARNAAVPLRVQPVTSMLPALPLRFGIALGLRRGDSVLRGRLETALARRRNEIDAVLERYGIPTVAAEHAQGEGGHPHREGGSR